MSMYKVLFKTSVSKKYLRNFCQDSPIFVEAVKGVAPSLDDIPVMRVQLLSRTHPKLGNWLFCSF